MAFPSISDPLKKKRGIPQMAPPSIDPYANGKATAHTAPGASTNVSSLRPASAATAIEENPNDKMGGVDSLDVRRGQDTENERKSHDDPAMQPDSAPSDIDNLEDGFIRKSLDPNAADTTEEEALVNQKILDQLGGNLVDQRARMGRAGFGASGALAGLEGDTMRKANQDAASSIYDIREREQNQAFQQGQAATQLDIQKQAEAAREAEAQAQYEAIQALIGGDTATPPDAPPEIADPTNPDNYVPHDVPDATGAHGQDTASKRASAKEVSSQPAGSTLAASEGGYNYYTDAHGNWFKVKVTTMHGDY